MFNSQYSISHISKNFGRLAFYLKIKTQYIEATDCYIISEKSCIILLSFGLLAITPTKVETNNVFKCLCVEVEF